MVTLFQDDFDSGRADDWDLDDGWAVDLDDRDFRNFVLSGSGRTWATLLLGEDWTDYSLRFRMKIIRGGVHLSYRVRGAGSYTLGGRYYVGFGQHGAVLRKEAPWGTQADQAGYSGHCTLGTWHDFEIRTVRGDTKFYIDGVRRLHSTDGNPLERGTIGFETLDDSQVHIDDVVVIGRPPPEGFKWVRLNGPLGGLGYDVRIDPIEPNVMYVTDNFAGVAKSTDGGNTWRQTNTGITARLGPSGDAIPIFCLTVDPRRHNVLWAGASDGARASAVRGIFRSTDCAATWSRKDKGIVEQHGITFRSFTIDPKNSNIVYCGAEIATGERGLENEKVKGKIYRTLDGGKNWSAVWDGDALVRHIVIDPTDSSVVYAATGIFDREAYNSDVPNGIAGGVGILKNTSGGRPGSWRQTGRSSARAIIPTGRREFAPAFQSI
jgi:hypothetical protein